MVIEYGSKITFYSLYNSHRLNSASAANVNEFKWYHEIIPFHNVENFAIFEVDFQLIYGSFLLIIKIKDFAPVNV